MIRFFGTCKLCTGFDWYINARWLWSGGWGADGSWWNDQERKKMPADYVLPPVGQEMPESEAKTNADTEPVAPVKTDDPAKKSSSAGAVPRGLQ